jgi:hypothetical protein
MQVVVAVDQVGRLDWAVVVLVVVVVLAFQEQPTQAAVAVAVVQMHKVVLVVQE